MSEVAKVFGLSEPQLRRALIHCQSSGPTSSGRSHATFRAIVTWACVLHAENMLKQGVKVEAALLMSGFRNKTNFNRQCRAFLGCLPHECSHEGRL